MKHPAPAFLVFLVLLVLGMWKSKASAGDVILFVGAGMWFEAFASRLQARRTPPQPEKPA